MKRILATTALGLLDGAARGRPGSHAEVPPHLDAHRHGAGERITPWCDKVAAESNNRIKCQLLPAMSGGGTPRAIGRSRERRR